jgi:hypothetical protein
MGVQFVARQDVQDVAEWAGGFAVKKLDRQDTYERAINGNCGDNHSPKIGGREVIPGGRLLYGAIVGPG